MTTLTPHIHTFLTSRRKQGRYNPTSIRGIYPRLRSLDEHFGNRPINRLTTREVERWLESLERLSQNSRASYLASVRQFTRWLVAEKLLSSDPCPAIPSVPRARSVPRALTADAVAETLRHCRSDRERAIVWLMVGLGLRRVEVATIRWEDYDERGRTIHITGKGGHQRVLPVPDQVAHALDRVRVRGNTGPIIRSDVNGQPIQAATIGKLMSDLLRRAGVKRAPYDGVSGHAYRHTAASDVLDHCGDLRVVQQMLGHAQLQTTSIYLRRANLTAIREAMDGREYDGYAGPKAA